jgi:transcription elongation factor GreA
MADDTILTESSLRRLQDELDHLRSAKRRELAEALRKARAYGDLSENFEYHAARREQAIVNGRIAELERTIERATVVPDTPVGEPDSVGLGCVVTVREMGTGEDWEFTLVDPVQADPVSDLISISSPLGQAALGRTAGDLLEVRAPAGVLRYEVLEIRH